MKKYDRINNMISDEITGDILNKISVEYSMEHGNFRINALGRILHNNRMDIQNNNENSYILIGVFDTEGQAYRFIHEYYTRLKRR